VLLSLPALTSGMLILVALVRPRPAAFVVDVQAVAFRTVSQPGYFNLLGCLYSAGLRL
jgi:hypothetical protein